MTAEVNLLARDEVLVEEVGRVINWAYAVGEAGLSADLALLSAAPGAWANGVGHERIAAALEGSRARADDKRDRPERHSGRS